DHVVIRLANRPVPRPANVQEIHREPGVLPTRSAGQGSEFLVSNKQNPHKSSPCFSDFCGAEAARSAADFWGQNASNHAAGAGRSNDFLMTLLFPTFAAFFALFFNRTVRSSK